MYIYKTQTTAGICFGLVYFQACLASALFYSLRWSGIFYGTCN